MMQANMAMLNKDRKYHVMTQRFLSAARTDGHTRPRALLPSNPPICGGHKACE